MNTDPFLLETPRLILRRFTDADLETFLAYRSDPEVARYQDWDAPYPREMAEAFVAEMKAAAPGVPGVWFQIAIQRRKEPGLIGDCVFHILEDDPRQAEIGYTLAREFQGQGYASEAVGRMLDYLFRDLHLHRVTATCDALNPASYHLMERLGMRREAHHVENIWFKGEWGSEFQYAILEREWLAGH